jgi:hypothetical protein
MVMMLMLLVTEGFVIRLAISEILVDKAMDCKGVVILAGEVEV